MAVSILRDIDPDDILGERQITPIVRARHEVMWNLRRMTWAGRRPGYVLIGRWVWRDHSSVIHGVRQHERRLASS